jgi:long-chain-fatty-acid--CoA ligase ACSBG
VAISQLSIKSCSRRYAVARNVCIEYIASSNPLLPFNAKGTKADNTPFSKWTWKQYRTKVDTFAKALLSLEFQQFDVINIIGFNSREWFVANFGAIAAGGVAAGIYTTNLPDACKYISEHSEAKVVVVEDLVQLQKYISIAGDLPKLKAIVMYGPYDLPEDIKVTCSVPCYTFDDFLKLGKKSFDKELATRIKALKPEHTCTLIYTSGTTGPPKAVMITHDNITWTVRSMLSVTPRGKLDENDVMISYLPLSHIAAQMLDMHLPLVTGGQTYFAQPDALKGSLGGTLKEVRPTCFFGVPRVWEKIYDKLQEVAKASTGTKKKLSTWAKKNALQHWESKEFGSKTQSPHFQYFLAKKLLHKAHIALGLDRAQALYVSAAPIEVKILKYFASLDLPIMELFGQSECCGPHSVNKLKAFKIGTVGRPLPGTETKIDEVTGELCCKCFAQRGRIE